MCFWLFMLICDLLVPIIMIVGGRIMWKHCPKHIKWYIWIQNNSFNEKYGYMEICTRLLRKTLVENRMGNDPTICFDTYSVIPW